MLNCSCSVPGLCAFRSYKQLQYGDYSGARVKQKPLLVAHIIHRFTVGGLENGLVNLINGIPLDRYRHAIISLTDYTEFRGRIRRADVLVIALHERGGKDFRTHFRLWRLLRKLRPDRSHAQSSGIRILAGGSARGRSRARSRRAWARYLRP